jgi:oligopeptide transport system permease protein
MAVGQAVAGERMVLQRRQASLWGDAWRRLLKNKAATVGGIVVLILVLTAILAPVIAPYPFDLQNVSVETVDQPPSWAHWAGTDNLGRDLFSRLLYGARVSIAVGMIVQLIVLLIGLPIGAIAGFAGGRTDNLLMRFTDIMYAFPDLLFVIILVTALRDTPLAELWSGLFLVFFAIGLTHWTTMARLVRGQILSLKEKEFVEAARAVGVSNSRIILRHLLPNTIGPVIVAVTLGIPAAIMLEATLSFLGIGVQPPNASWGTLIQDGFVAVTSYPHEVIFPALAVALTMLSFTFLGDGLRDALDPYMKK